MARLYQTYLHPGAHDNTAGKNKPYPAAVMLKVSGEYDDISCGQN
jgi:hypothetical protein